MSGRSGPDALKEIKMRLPDLLFLVLSICGGKLIIAICKIVSGGKYVSPILAEKLADSFQGQHHQMPHKALSARENQVMCMIADGKSADHIAKELSISIHTIYSYRNRILQKLRLKSNVELTKYVLGNKLI